MKFIGDVHGKYKQYHAIIRANPNTIQVGDMGVGFIRYGNYREGELHANPFRDLMLETGARFIRGNHDNPGWCKRHSQWIKDGHVETTQNGTKIMFVGGAFSIDKAYRREGYDWWADEELSQAEMWDISLSYEKEKPDVMVTHDCPIVMVQEMHSHHMFDNSKTQQFMQSLWNMHKPKLWIFGHHHHPFDMEIEGTRFVCLEELRVREFDI